MNFCLQIFLKFFTKTNKLKKYFIYFIYRFIIYKIKYYYLLIKIIKKLIF